MSSFRSFVQLAAIAVLAGIVPARAEPAKWYETGFTQTLSIEDQTAAGFAKLTDDEQSLLNVSVAREVSLARAGNVRGFAGTFISRRTADERAKIGLDRLTPDEQARLNRLVAVAIAAGPVRPDVPQKYGKGALSVMNRLEIHGEVSLTVGTAGHGRSFYGTSFFTTITDPETNLTIGFGYEQFKGKGWLGYGLDDYDYADYGVRGHGFEFTDCVHRH